MVYSRINVSPSWVSCPPFRQNTRNSREKMMLCDSVQRRGSWTSLWAACSKKWRTLWDRTSSCRSACWLCLVCPWRWQQLAVLFGWDGEVQRARGAGHAVDLHSKCAFFPSTELSALHSHTTQSIYNLKVKGAPSSSLPTPTSRDFWITTLPKWGP